ncbi:MAG: hypothetical protein ACXVLZ_17990, partial [Acidimicrobiia bacterium]
RCPDCGVALEAGQVRRTAPTPSPPASVPEGPFSAADDPVELRWVGALEAGLLAGQLRAAGIAVSLTEVSNFSGDAGPALRYSEGSRLLVRRADLALAQQVLRDVQTGELSDEELAAQAEAAGGAADYGDGAVV